MTEQERQKIYESIFARHAVLVRMHGIKHDFMCHVPSINNYSCDCIDVVMAQCGYRHKNGYDTFAGPSICIGVGDFDSNLFDYFVVDSTGCGAAL